jgi:ABC-type multidrug transport system fused ATPase/permease subunit
MTAPEVLPASQRPAFWPAQPPTLAELDISPTLVQDIFMRTVREQGQSSLSSLRERLKLPPAVLEPVFRQLRQQAYLDVKGIQDNDYHFGLTAAGKALAAERASMCAYAGPAPVSLAAYDRAVRLQAAHVQVSRDSLRQALDDLVLPEHLLDQLGPALISQKALFLYGPTGNGKTSLAERLLRVYEDAVLIPYALELSGYVITTASS